MDPSGTDDDIGDEHLFDGIRFFLVGFDSDVESQVRPRQHPRLILFDILWPQFGCGLPRLA
jgi:hypothetical protein